MCLPAQTGGVSLFLLPHAILSIINHHPAEAMRDANEGLKDELRRWKDGIKAGEEFYFVGGSPNMAQSQ